MKRKVPLRSAAGPIDGPTVTPRRDADPAAAQAKSAATNASGSNGQEVADLSPTPTKPDRDLSRVLDGEDDAALGRRVELGQDDAGQADRLVERLRLGEAVLAGRGVEHEERLRARRPAAACR